FLFGGGFRGLLLRGFLGGGFFGRSLFCRCLLGLFFDSRCLDGRRFVGGFGGRFFRRRLGRGFLGRRVHGFRFGRFYDRFRFSRRFGLGGLRQFGGRPRRRSGFAGLIAGTCGSRDAGREARVLRHGAASQGNRQG